MNRIIDKGRVPSQRSPLGSGFQVSFASKTVLNIGEFIAKCGHHLGQHHPAVGFDDLGPVGIALRGEVQKRTAQTREVARQVVNREIDQVWGWTLGLAKLAVEVAGAALFKRELDAVEKAINAGRVDR